jgi:hypothetical protein
LEYRALSVELDHPLRKRVQLLLTH